MKIPAKETNRYQILLTLYRYGAMTREEASRYLPSIDGFQLKNSFKRAMENGELARVGHVYRLMPAVADHFYATEDRPAHIPKIVPPRVNNVYAAPPIRSQHIPSALGTRAGSNDHLNWNSPFGRKAV